jgi:branched-chain amino acid transport system substrate-binding protein
VKAAAAILLVACITLACQGAAGDGSRPDIVIASDLPTSASGSTTLLLEQAIDFAIRRQPTIDGFRLAYWPLDNALGAQPSQLRGRENVKRMIADPSVLGEIGPYASSIARVEIPVANQAHLAMVSPTTTGSCLTVAAPKCSPTAASLRPTDQNNYFRVTPRDPLQGKAIADYAASTLGVRRVAAFNEFGPEGSLFVKELSDELMKFGGGVVYQEDIDDPIVNFSAFLSQAKAHGADAVYALGRSEDGVCKAAAQMSTTMPGAIFLATDGISLHDDCFADLGVSPPAVWSTLPAIDAGASTDPAVKKLVADFHKSYPNSSSVSLFDPYTFAAYDCARILIDAVSRAIKANGGKVPSRAQVVAALAGTNNFVGVTGTYSFDKNGDAVSPMMSIYKVQDKRWELVEVYKFGSP